MAYIDIDYIKTRVDDNLLSNLLPEISGDEDDAHNDVINQKISVAESKVNGYLSSRYKVPVTANEDLKNITFDIVMYLLYTIHRTNQVDEEIRNKYKDALRQLERIAEGKSSLAGISEKTASTSKVGVKASSKSTDRKFTRSILSNR